MQPKSEADSDQSQFMRSRVLRSQRLRRRIVGTRRTLQGTSLRRCSSSRDGLRLGKTHSAAQGNHERSRYPRNLGYISMKTRTTESLTTYSASCRAGVQVSSVSTVDRMYTTWTQTPLHDICQFVHSETQLSGTTHSRLSVHTLLVETGRKSRVISTASFQKQEQSYCHLAVIHILHIFSFVVWGSIRFTCFSLVLFSCSICFCVFLVILVIFVSLCI